MLDILTNKSRTSSQKRCRLQGKRKKEIEKEYKAKNYKLGHHQGRHQS